MRFDIVLISSFIIMEGWLMFVSAALSAMNKIPFWKAFVFFNGLFISFGIVLYLFVLIGAKMKIYE